MLVWFAALAALGLVNLMKAPQILVAVNPVYAIAFLHEHALQAFVVLGSVFLVLTGAEALYADMGTSVRGRSAGAGSSSWRRACC